MKIITKQNLINSLPERTQEITCTECKFNVDHAVEFDKDTVCLDCLDRSTKTLLSAIEMEQRND